MIDPMRTDLFPSESQITAKIIEVCSRLNMKGYIAAGDGNISYLIDKDHLLVTARGRNKAFLTPNDFAVANLSGDALRGEPSTELAMHAAIYRHCPEARCVVHAHPPAAIAYSVAHPEAKELPTDSLPEVILGVGRIPIATYARPGTSEMGQVLTPYLKEGRAYILARHGALAWGESLTEAYNGIERIEHAAQVINNATQLGGAKPLPEEELRWLMEKRAASPSRNL